jgi:hypothetical protein
MTNEYRHSTHRLDNDVGHIILAAVFHWARLAFCGTYIVRQAPQKDLKY